ncbi:hypothetical protein A2U01_0068554, partial [Trifolium medium]|nr:hypothetical protein [Trifolium medium]
MGQWQSTKCSVSARRAGVVARRARTEYEEWNFLSIARRAGKMARRANKWKGKLRASVTCA